MSRSDNSTHPLNAWRLVGGFTLLELVTVIAVIGILSSIVMVSLGTAREKARDGRRIAEIKNLQLALGFYFEVNGRYPTFTEFGTGGTVPLVPTYISVMPKDPSTGANYVYAQDPSGFDYHLGAALEDDNPELENDADGTLGFQGASPDCGPTAGADFCYDVKAQ